MPSKTKSLHYHVLSHSDYFYGESFDYEGVSKSKRESNHDFKYTRDRYSYDTVQVECTSEDCEEGQHFYNVKDVPYVRQY